MALTQITNVCQKVNIDMIKFISFSGQKLQIIPHILLMYANIYQNKQ